MIVHDHRIVSLLTKIHYFSPLGLKYTLPKIQSPVINLANKLDLPRFSTSLRIQGRVKCGKGTKGVTQHKKHGGGNHTQFLDGVNNWCGGKHILHFQEDIAQVLVSRLRYLIRQLILLQDFFIINIYTYIQGVSKKCNIRILCSFGLISQATIF